LKKRLLKNRNCLLVQGGEADSHAIVSRVDDLRVFAAILERMAKLAIDPRVVYVARLPTDRAGGCLYAQPLAAEAAMRFSCRIILLHRCLLFSSPKEVGRVVETGMFYKNSMAPHIVNILIPSIIASASKPTLIEL
jgi:hypothetical protein